MRCGSATRIGRSSFVRRIELPSLLYERVIEVDERIGARGEIVQPLDIARGGGRAARRAPDAGIGAVAIVLMHGYRFPQHEQALRRRWRARSASRRSRCRTR